MLVLQMASPDRSGMLALIALVAVWTSECDLYVLRSIFVGYRGRVAGFLLISIFVVVAAPVNFQGGLAPLTELNGTRTSAHTLDGLLLCVIA